MSYNPLSMKTRLDPHLFISRCFKLCLPHLVIDRRIMSLKLTVAPGTFATETQMQYAYLAMTVFIVLGMAEDALLFSLRRQTVNECPGYVESCCVDGQRPRPQH